MSKLARVTQQPFGSTAGTDQVAQFGSFAAGDQVFTTDPTQIQSLSQFLTGWFSAIIANSNPCIEDMNSLFVLAFYQLGYLLQEGVPEWIATTTYYTGSVVQAVGTGILHVSLVDSNLNNATTDGTKWRPLLGWTGNSATTLNFTVTTGNSYMRPNITVPASTTWTVQAGASLIGINSIVVPSGSSLIVASGGQARAI